MSIKKYVREKWFRSLYLLYENIVYQYADVWKSYGWLKRKYLFAKRFARIITGGGVLIPQIDLSVTEKCSLKCKNCVQWNPYIHHPIRKPFQPKAQSKS